MTPRVLEQDASTVERPHRWWRMLGYAGIGLIALVVLLALAGFSWNELATRYYRETYPPPGRLYAVEGRAMHMYCTGNGAPTLVLDAGLGDNWTIWTKVQAALSKATRVCSYDRSGLGSSDLLPGAHDADTSADQLHALVAQADIEKPFVLAGHSIAGVYIRAYATRYPHDLAGLIFIDGSSPDQFQRLPKELTQNAPNFFLQSWLMRLGIMRAMGHCTHVVRGAEAVSHWMFAYACNPRSMDAWIGEYRDIPRSMDETRHSGPFQLPVLIVSQDPDHALHDASFSPAVRKQTSVVWNQLQEQLKQLSPDSRRIIATGSGHYIELDRPDLLNREIPVFIDQIRNGVPAPDAGSTNKE